MGPVQRVGGNRRSGGKEREVSLRRLGSRVWYFGVGGGVFFFGMLGK
jgi:hypothetical protein